MDEPQSESLIEPTNESPDDSLSEDLSQAPDMQAVEAPPIQQKLFPSRRSLIACFLADILIAIFIGVALFLPVMIWMNNSDFVLFFGALFTQLGLSIVCIRRIRNFRKVRIPVLPFFEGPFLPALRWGVIAGLALFGLNVLHGVILDRLFGFDVTDNNPWLKIQDYSTMAMSSTLVVGGIVAPIVEEFLLRGVMFGAFVASGYKKTGIFFTVCLFILLHLDPYNIDAYAILGLGAYAILGFGFLWVYLRTRNLASAILAHFINNALGFLFILLPQ